MDYRDYLSIITDRQYDRIVKYTQDNPRTEFRIICFCGCTDEGRMLLWRGPERYLTWLELIK